MPIENCPHCGVRVIFQADAACPHCKVAHDAPVTEAHRARIAQTRRARDERPARLREAQARRARSGTIQKAALGGFLVGGAALVFFAFQLHTELAVLFCATMVAAVVVAVGTAANQLMGSPTRPVQGRDA